ncbi:Ribulose-phosphate 3-epimerase [Bacillus licheniformis]|nr:Ribulose-phosphate 3-epimerase [Bacillus licheniformis]
MLEDLDLVLLMTVNPGFGGQSFISSVLPKIRQVKEMAEQKGLADLLIEVDGGVNKNTARQCIEAGANLLVAGSAVYNEKDRKKAISDIKGALG